MKPMCPARQSASSDSESVVMSRPPTRSSPLSGLSMPAMRLSSVLLPDPDGPMSAVNSPGMMSKLMSFNTGTICPPRWYVLYRRRTSMNGGAELIDEPDDAASAFGALHGDFVAVVQLRSRIGDDLRARLDAFQHLDRIAELGARFDLRLDR